MESSPLRHIFAWLAAQRLDLAAFDPRAYHDAFRTIHSPCPLDHGARCLDYSPALPRVSLSPDLCHTTYLIIPPSSHGHCFICRYFDSTANQPFQCGHDIDAYLRLLDEYHRSLTD